MVGAIGGVVASICLALASESPNVTILAAVYGIMCGFGFGMVYMSLIVCCSYYFKKRLALAQGIMGVGASIGLFTFHYYLYYSTSIFCKTNNYQHPSSKANAHILNTSCL